MRVELLNLVIVEFFVCCQLCHNIMDCLLARLNVVGPTDFLTSCLNQSIRFSVNAYHAHVFGSSFSHTCSISDTLGFDAMPARYNRPMNIRPATEADIQALSALATQTWLDAFSHRYPQEEHAGRIEKYRSEQYFTKALTRDVIFLAEQDGALIGYVEFGPPDLPIPTQAGDQEITRLYVLASHQRKGIGKALLETVLAHPLMQAAQTIYLDVWEKNEGAIRLYTSYGFKETDQIIDGDVIMVLKK